VNVNFQKRDIHTSPNHQLEIKQPAYFLVEPFAGMNMEIKLRFGRGGGCFFFSGERPAMTFFALLIATRGAYMGKRNARIVKGDYGINGLGFQGKSGNVSQEVQPFAAEFLPRFPERLK
jgi:hypothetical protein